MSDNDTMLSLSLDQNQYNVFERVFMYGRTFGDDIAELESVHDDIWNIAEKMVPTAG
ncbi:MAG: hypothetical protein OEY94_10015 [Alphaproteobacteria bacterium]|nr:hypothetical protein [Alphaproteobacteria bacterium]